MAVQDKPAPSRGTNADTADAAVFVLVDGMPPPIRDRSREDVASPTEGFAASGTPPSESD
jgi:hypothetical protein